MAFLRLLVVVLVGRLPQGCSPAAGFRCPASAWSLLFTGSLPRMCSPAAGLRFPAGTWITSLCWLPFRQGARLRRASERLPASGSLLFAGPKRSNQEKWPGELGERQELGARAMTWLRSALRGATAAIPRALGNRGKGSAALTSETRGHRASVFDTPQLLRGLDACDSSTTANDKSSTSAKDKECRSLVRCAASPVLVASVPERPRDSRCSSSKSRA